MEIDLNRLDELRDIRKRRAELQKLESELTKPELTDTAELPRLYECFRRLTDDLKRNRYVKRRMFVFIAVWLYSPTSLVNERLADGVRTSLAQTLGLKSRSIISNELRDLLFIYESYSEFRRDTNRIFTQMMQELGYSSPPVEAEQ